MYFVCSGSDVAGAAHAVSNSISTTVVHKNRFIRFASVEVDILTWINSNTALQFLMLKTAMYSLIVACIAYKVHPNRIC